MNLRALLIEDNEENRYLTTYLLESSGMSVAQASNGQAGIVLAAEARFDVILLDIQLPEMDGHAVAAKLRALPGLATTPIIAITSYAMAGDRERSIAAGCSAYMEKPIDPATFVDRVIALASACRAASASSDTEPPGHAPHPIPARRQSTRCIVTRVLIVDDNVQNLYMLSSLLQGHGCEVTQAHHGAEALAMSAAAPPDLVISDLLMPVMDGYALLLRWKSDPQLSKVPFVVYTATFTGAKDRQLALDLGADDFIVKPAEPAVFVEMVRDVLARRNLGTLAPTRALPPELDGVLLGYNQALVRKLEETSTKLAWANEELTRRNEELSSTTALLRENKQRLRAIFDQAAVGIARVGIDGHWIDANPRLCEILGFPREELLRTTFQAITHPDDLESNLNHLRRALAGEIDKYLMEKRYRRKNGRFIWANLATSLVRDELGNPLYFISVVEDIDTRKKAEAAAREQEQLLKLFVEHTPAAVAMFDRDMRYVAVSRRWITDYNLSDENLIGRSHYDVFPGLSEERKQRHQRVMAGATEHNDGEPIGRADGTIDWVRWEYCPWYKEVAGERIIGGIVMFTEVITDRKKTEAQLAAAAANIDLMVRASNIGLWDWDLSTNFVHYSREWKTQLGLAENEIENTLREWEQRVHPDDLKLTLARVDKYFADPSLPYEAEFRMRHKDGSWRWIYSQGEVIRNREGRPIRMLGCHIDITARKEREAALRESEQTLSTLMANLPGMAYRCVNDPTWTMTFVSRGCIDVTGYAVDELEGNRVVAYGDLVHPEDREALWAKCQASLDAHTPCLNEYRIIDKSGAVRWVMERATGTYAEDNSLLYIEGFVQDITSRKRSEQALAASERRFRTLVEGAGVIVWEANPLTHTFTYVSPQAELLGYPLEEWYTPDFWSRHVHPDDRDRAVAFSRSESAAGRGHQFQYRMLAADGRTVWIEDYLSVEPLEGGAWIERGVLVDITEIKRAAEFAQALAERDTAAAVGASVAHEFRSLLFALSLKIERGIPPSQETEGTPQSRARLLIREAQMLAGSLLDLYSRTDTAAPQPISLHPWLPETVSRLARPFPPGIRVTVEVEFDLPEAMANPLGLEQVVRTLLINASNVLGTTGEIHVSANSATVDGRPMVELRVSDNGPGIPEALLPRIFQPGFTTSARPYRSGLGLVIAARLLEQFGSTIHYERGSLKGSTFVIRLLACIGEPG